MLSLSERIMSRMEVAVSPPKEDTIRMVRMIKNART